MTRHDGMKLHLSFSFMVFYFPENMSKISITKSGNEADANGPIPNLPSTPAEDQEAGPSGDYNVKDNLPSPCSSLDEELYGNSVDHLARIKEIRRALNFMELSDDIVIKNAPPKTPPEEEYTQVERITSGDSDRKREVEYFPPYYNLSDKQFNEENFWKENSLATIYEGSNSLIDLRSSGSGTSQSYCIPEKRLCTRDENSSSCNRLSLVKATWVKSSPYLPEPSVEIPDVLKEQSSIHILTDYDGSDLPFYSGDFYSAKNDLNINIPSSICDDSSNPPTHRITVTTLSDSSDENEPPRSNRSQKKQRKPRKRALSMKRPKSYSVRTFSSEETFFASKSPNRSSASEDSLQTLSDRLFSSPHASKSSATYSIFSCCTTGSKLAEFEDHAGTISDQQSDRSSGGDFVEKPKDDKVAILFNPLITSSLELPPKTLQTYDFPAISKIASFTGPTSAFRAMLPYAQSDDGEFAGGDFVYENKNVPENFRSYKNVAQRILVNSSGNFVVSNNVEMTGKKEKGTAMGLVPRKTQSTDISFYSVPSPSQCASFTTDYDTFQTGSEDDDDKGCFCVCLFFPKKKRNPFL